MRPIWALGLMSGTSGDGIGLALLKTDGEEILEYGPGLSVPYDDDFRDRLKACFGQSEVTPESKYLEQELTKKHADAVSLFRTQFDVSIDLLGFHGQTLFHDPPIRTWQIGDGNLLADLTGIDVVYDFRSHDVSQGGQGAPLVPIFHRGMVEDLERPVAVVNVGGVANITVVGDDLIGFDTGPGNALLDDWMKKHFGVYYDHNGETCAQGIIDWDCVHRWMQDPYFQKSYPKSLDRNQFLDCFSDLDQLSPADGAATLMAFTAMAIVQAIKQIPTLPKNLFVSGGGRYNLFLMGQLRHLLPALKIDVVDTLGIHGCFVEAYAFAFLAVRSKLKLPITFPLTTGCKEPLTGGKLSRKKRKISYD